MERQKYLSKAREHIRYDPAMKLLLLSMVLGLAYGYISQGNGVVTPWGPVYFVDDPGIGLRRHEECHYEKLRKEGSLQFYIDYARNPCKEESRCAQPEHRVCDLPWGTGPLKEDERWEHNWSILKKHNQ